MDPLANPSLSYKKIKRNLKPSYSLAKNILLDVLFSDASQAVWLVKLMELDEL
jgi:hypothetical protein